MIFFVGFKNRNHSSKCTTIGSLPEKLVANKFLHFAVSILGAIMSACPPGNCLISAQESANTPAKHRQPKILNIGQR